MAHCGQRPVMQRALVSGIYVVRGGICGSCMAGSTGLWTSMPLSLMPNLAWPHTVWNGLRLTGCLPRQQRKCRHLPNLPGAGSSVDWGVERDAAALGKEQTSRRGKAPDRHGGRERESCGLWSGIPRPFGLGRGPQSECLRHDCALELEGMG